MKIRLILLAATALASCPWWYGLNASGRFPNRVASECLIMRIYSDDAGNDVVQYFREYGEIHSHGKMMPDPPGIVGTSRATSTELSDELWHTELTLSWAAANANWGIQVRGAPVRLFNDYMHRVDSRVHGINGAPSDQLRDYWLVFADALAAGREELRTASWMEDRAFASKVIPTTVSDLATVLRAELGANPARFLTSGAGGGFGAWSTYWPGVTWVAIRATLSACFVASALFAVATLRRLLSLDWRTAPWCPRCRYSLDPGMPHCPECGTMIRWPKSA